MSHIKISHDDAYDFNSPTQLYSYKTMISINYSFHYNLSSLKANTERWINFNNIYQFTFIDVQTNPSPPNLLHTNGSTTNIDQSVVDDWTPHYPDSWWSTSSSSSSIDARIGVLAHPAASRCSEAIASRNDSFDHILVEHKFLNLFVCVWGNDGLDFINPTERHRDQRKFDLGNTKETRL